MSIAAVTRFLMLASEPMTAETAYQEPDLPTPWNEAPDPDEPTLSFDLDPPWSKSEPTGGFEPT